VAAFFSRHYQPVLYVLLSLGFIAGIGFLIYSAFRRSGARNGKRVS